MKGETIALILLSLTGVGIIFFGFYFLYSTIQNNNAMLEAEISSMDASRSGGGGLLGDVLSIFGL